jgi:hypothetical protein
VQPQFRQHVAGAEFEVFDDPSSFDWPGASAAAGLAMHTIKTSATSVTNQWMKWMGLKRWGILFS